MKKILLFILVVGWSWQIAAQVSITNDGTDPNASSMLEVKSTAKGFLPPRMSKSQRNSILSPAEGLMVICTDCGSDNSARISLFLNGSWQNFMPASDILAPPVEGVHIAYSDSIIWKWNPVSGAVGYKWGITNVISSAVDVGKAVIKKETGLTPLTAYTRYVWAYNDAGVTSPATLCKTTDIWLCGSHSFTINHVTTGGVAPVNKSVTYGTAGPIAGEPNKCWISRNLGASQQATSADDASEASAGWYWQFNRKQGYKGDGSVITPTWPLAGISENSEWLVANDPCTHELGNIWRLPTNTEWENIRNSGGWTNYSGPFNSALKLHAGGWIDPSGSHYANGVIGEYTSSTQGNLYFGYSFDIREFNAFVTASFEKTFGCTVRCLVGPNTQVSTTAITAIKAFSATGGGDINSGTSTIAGRGVCWGTAPSPTISNNHTTDGSGAGSFASSITGLDPNTTYYVRAYATNGNGTSYGNEVSFTTEIPFYCGYPFTINHEVAHGVAPVAKTVTYNTINNIPGENTKCWITRNLGASQQASAVNDNTEASAGWYWQFNRKQGFKHDGTTLTPSWTTSTINENSDWLITNDPCNIELGSAWRLPTYSEWTNVDNANNWTTWTGPWNSGLKLHASGYLNNGALSSRGTIGNLWSKSQYMSTLSYNFYLSVSFSQTSYSEKGLGFTVRCIREN